MLAQRPLGSANFSSAVNSSPWDENHLSDQRAPLRGLGGCAPPWTTVWWPARIIAVASAPAARCRVCTSRRPPGPRPPPAAGSAPAAGSRPVAARSTPLPLPGSTSPALRSVLGVASTLSFPVSPPFWLIGDSWSLTVAAASPPPPCRSAYPPLVGGAFLFLGPPPLSWLPCLPLGQQQRLHWRQRVALVATGWTRRRLRRPPRRASIPQAAGAAAPALATAVGAPAPLGRRSPRRAGWPPGCRRHPHWPGRPSAGG